MKKIIVLVALAIGLYGCGGGGSSSGGGPVATNYLNDCQICSYNEQCKSGWCAGPYAKTGQYRCTPQNANMATWRCPTGMVKLPAGDTSLEEWING